MREMTAPDMATITESLERSMQNCSLSNRRRRVGVGQEESSTSNDNIYAKTEHIPISDRTLELNTNVSLPCHWEQCLDLKTGEIYYINWKNGMKVKEDPRRRVSKEYVGYSYSEEDSSYDSEGSSSESSSSPSLSSSSSSESSSTSRRVKKKKEEEEEEEEVLVVAGCKACFMYFMVPKHVDGCPKCATAQLIHFDRPLHSASS